MAFERAATLEQSCPSVLEYPHLPPTAQKIATARVATSSKLAIENERFRIAPNGVIS
jgi:hypothetical protein